MSIKATKWVWEQTSLSHTQKVVLLCLADHCNDSLEAWPSAQTIASRTGLSRRGVQKSIKEIEGLKLINTERRQTERGRNKACFYRLNVCQGMVNTVRHTGEYGSPGMVNTVRTEPHNLDPTTEPSPPPLSPPSPSFYGTTEAKEALKDFLAMEKSMNQQPSPWTPPRIALYQALDALHGACGGVLGVGYVFKEKEAPNELGGSLIPKVEEAFRNLLRSYVKERGISFQELLEQLKILGKYIKNRQPFQLQKRNLSLQELCRRKDWFEQWMEAAHAWKKEVRVVQAQPRSLKKEPTPSSTEEEAQEAQRMLTALKQKLGIKTTHESNVQV